jgi:energy-coupling factor transporter ATP-binding protein EcfA2
MKPKTQSLLNVAETLNSGTIPHRRFKEASDRLVRLIRFPTDTKLALVIGPTGAGKSKLIEYVSAVIAEVASDAIQKDRGQVPCVSFEVPSVQIGNFHWPSFYEIYLNQLKTVLLPFKDSPDLTSSSGYSKLDNVVIKALQHRRPLATLLDEANHFAQVTSAKLLSQQMDRIKSLANRSGVLHICFGTYEVARMMGVSGQLARRTEVIHLPRYHVEDEEDMAEFEGIVAGFAQALPLAKDLDLRDHVMFLHERSLGAVGALKTWITRALAIAEDQGRRHLILEDFRKSVMPLYKLETMLKEATDGEAIFREEERDLLDFRRALGHVVDSPKDAKDDTPNRTSGRAVGERRLGRDPVGGTIQLQFPKLAS